MSLNGLDTPDVQRAYQSAIVEAGGWFLLRYTSRDSVELYGRGQSGVHEARTAIAKYEEASPLYGLIIYRRRKVLIKYIPEGTSRLLQARTAVHFQDILQAYSPYETLLELTNPDALNDTSLAASFPLHTASPSASSSRLHEISEDGEDGGATPRRPAARQSYSAAGPMFGTQRYKTERRVEQLMSGERPQPRARPAITPSIQVTSDNDTSPVTSPLASPQKTSISQFLVRDESGQRSITSLGSQRSIASVTEYASSEASVRSAESATTSNDQAEVDEVKQTTQTVSHEIAAAPRVERIHHEPRIESDVPEQRVERPSFTERRSTPDRVEPMNRVQDEEPYDFSRFDMKPKVKLGPRPVTTIDKTKRPSTAGIATLPPSFRSAQKRQEPARPASQLPVIAPARIAPVSTLPTFPRPPPIPDTPEYTPRPVSRGSIKSLPSHKSTAMTPDKIRLMKAVELRKKQMRKSNPQPAISVPPRDEDLPAVPTLPSSQNQLPRRDASARIQQPEEIVTETRGKREAAPEKHPRREAGSMSHLRDELRAPTKKPDSGIEMGYPNPEAHEEGKQAEDQDQHFEEPVADQLTLTALETSQSVEQQPHVNPEPTFSLDMLDDAPMPALAHVTGSPVHDKDSFRDFSRDYETGPAPQLGASFVPSVVMADGTRPTSSRDRAAQATESGAAAEEDTSGSADDGLVNNATLGPITASPRRNNSDLAKRRRGIVEPLHLEQEPESGFNSDEEFLEELHSATVHQAKPVTMARSPIVPSFQRRPSAQSVYSEHSMASVRSVNIRRSSSNLLERFETASPKGSLDSSRTATGPSRSGSTPPYELSDPMQGLTRNVSTGISKRIQGLADASVKEHGLDASPRSMSPENSAQITWRERKSGVRSPPRTRTSSYKAAAKHGSRVSGYATPNANESAAVWNIQHDPSANHDSVSVTARIVRPSLVSPETEDVDHVIRDGYFQQPQLLINHKRASASQPSLNKALPPLNTNSALLNSASAPAVTPPLAVSPSVPRASSDYRILHSAHHRKSWGRHKQAMSPLTPSADDFPAPPMQKTHSQTSVASSNDENAAAKDSSRTSRFFKRMSNFGGKHERRRSGAQQSISGLSGTHSSADVSGATMRNGSMQDRSDMPPAVVVGDLNVQFPDSLLWKRRILEIDDAGYLLFAISQGMDVHRGVAPKRFHMSEFRMPYAPDLDRQELPHSVMLDFADGQTTLQAACEDAMTHRQILHVLRSYWKAWAGQA